MKYVTKPSKVIELNTGIHVFHMYQVLESLDLRKLVVLASVI